MMEMLLRKIFRFVVAFFVAWGNNAEATSIHDNLVVRWNQQFLEAIKEAKPSPPVVSRLLAVSHTCIYDAWSVYDEVAAGVHFNRDGSNRRRPSEHSSTLQKIAINQAAFECARILMPNGENGFSHLLKQENQKIAENVVSKDLMAEAIATGRIVAMRVLEDRLKDGANQFGNEACSTKSKQVAYCDDTGYEPKNPGPLSIALVSPNHWQPLPNGRTFQEPLAPHWGRVRPFSFESAERYIAANPIPEDRLPKRFGSSGYLMQVEQAILDSQVLANERSGNQKAIVEYWADGPFSYLPPGHFGELAHYVAHRDKMNLDDSVKMFFVLHNASFDAGIVLWHLKYIYDYVRPITAVRFVKQGTTIYAWGGPNTPWDETINTATRQPYGYNRYQAGETWLPYNPTNNPNHPLTPAFPEYVSGHSGFSAASAQALKMFTGSSKFGYVGIYDPYAPAWEPTLVEAPALIGRHQWVYPSFISAANQAGWSRRYGGIHFEDGDIQARTIGKHIGHLVWEKARYYFLGGDTNPECRLSKYCPQPDNIPDGEADWIEVYENPNFTDSRQERLN